VTPEDLDHIRGGTSRLVLSGMPEGMDALLISELLRAAAKNGGDTILHIARDDSRIAVLEEMIAFFAPEVEVLSFPAWDCLPYDRVSPHADICAHRMTVLSHLASEPAPAAGRVVLTTVNAAAQRVPDRSATGAAVMTIKAGGSLDVEQLTEYLAANGYSRVGQVMEAGEFSIRGGLVDLFPASLDAPVRLDLFGDEIESMRQFDPLSQRTTSKIDRLTLVPANEIILTPQSIQRFRAGYVGNFGPVTGDDPLYEAVVAGRKYQGMEHWLPLFHEELSTLFDYVPGALVTLDHLAEEAFAERHEAVLDHYAARKEAASIRGNFASTPYKPLPPEMLYLDTESWAAALAPMRIRPTTPYGRPEGEDSLDMGGRLGRDFAPERKQENVNIYDALREHVKALTKDGKRIVFASYSAGARDRHSHVFKDHGLSRLELVDSWKDAAALPEGVVGLIVLPFEHGFVTRDMAFITEQDLLGDRLVRKARRQRKADNFITEAAALSPGDYVVHIDHGVGRFEDLKTIDVGGAPHDCVMLTYDGGDRLYVPVENIEMLSRYGSDEATVTLDKLGGTGWQTRKARLKKRIREMADELIRVAAARELRTAETMTPAEGLYDEFCARFPYAETEDQLKAIGDVIDDLATGRPMDRLVCGDVGFGKTEVALRSAFLAVMAGHQVAVVVPTTLLCRQHLKTFQARFQGLPVRIAQLSRFATPKEVKVTKAGLKDGTVDIVVGTHALLGKDVGFRDLGLLIIDEEQHFGVSHKERLKKLKADVHVLTLTATPIPRTLQLAMSGLRGLSLIATPPVDRLAVRTFVLPVDALVIREALLREHYRGGQSFYVCPRVADLKEVEDFIRETVPEVKVAVAHGQMPPRQIEDVMNAFYDGKYDVLLSTTIVESGLDIPTANTLIIHRADMFGLAQLYQLRGRVGRSKIRAYAYFTLPPNRTLTDNAEKRLQVLQTLDTLGAGFTLASHDLDIRGAGNLLGEEQSGHIREVGIELYQQMLEEAVAEARSGMDDVDDSHWSPQINLGATVVLPESYIADLNVRMALYRRLAELETRDDIDAFAAELIDRFGPLPDEVNELFAVIEIKGHCRRAGIEKIEAGPKGANITFRNSEFANPAGLIAFITKEGTRAKLRPDHRLVVIRRWDSVSDRLQGVLHLARNLAKLAQAVAADGTKQPA
jgi:transcription-repair coupling factor (superfamily II helicase)